MSVKIRERVYPKTKMVTWQADIHVKLLDGRKIRERTRIPGATSRSAALKWARERERWLILHGHEEEVRKGEEGEEEEMAAAGVVAAAEAPTLAKFSERFMTEYVLANRLKPSSVYSKEKMLRLYLRPTLGELRLDQITEAEIQRLKARYAEQTPGSVNNILTLLGTMLKTAVEWGLIEAMPKIRKLKQPRPRFSFYEEETFGRLVEAAKVVDPRCYVAVLLGGDAGLRVGEIVALRLALCDLRRGVLHIEENDWYGEVRLPKGNRPRQVVMTSRLQAALAEVAAARGEDEGRVLLRDDGRPTSRRVIDGWLHKAQTIGGLPKKGPHILRHTFCSRLAAGGAPPKAIQELAGHVHSSTTDRYMHLAPSALRSAIGLLESGVARHVHVTSASAH